MFQFYVSSIHFSICGHKQKKMYHLFKISNLIIETHEMIKSDVYWLTRSLLNNEILCVQIGLGSNVS